MKIRSSLYRMVFALIVIPFLFFAMLIGHIYSGRLEKIITESLRVVANAQVAEMTNFCEQQKSYLSLVGMLDVSSEAMNGELDAEGERYLDNMLASYAQMIDYMKTLTILDEKYQVVASSDPEHRIYAEEGINLLIGEMGKESFFISDVLTDSQGNKTLVAISRFENESGLQGYALIEIDPDFYTELREKAELWEEATFYLLDGNNRIVSAGTADERRDEFVTTLLEREDYTKKYNETDFEKQPRGSFQYQVGGKHYITYYSDVTYSNWRIMLTVNLDGYRAEQSVYFSMGIFMVLLCSLLAVWIGWFASKRIVYPIQKISDTLKGIQGAQDYSLRVPAGRKDELGNLAVEINELIGFIETEDLYKTQQQRLLQKKAEEDALTKVLNKEKISQYLMDAVGRHQEDKISMAVLFVDIDDFKAFNSNYGHNTGDEVLVFVASLLAQETKGTVGRVGGDEFMVVLENPEYVKDLELCLKQVERAATSQFMVKASGTHLPVSCCIGAVRIDFSALNSKGELTAEQLTAMADGAMYQVKNNGKGGHFIVEY